MLETKEVPFGQETIERTERRLLSSITDSRKLLSLRTKGITPATFVVHKDVATFIWKYYKEYLGKIPSKELLINEFKDFQYEPFDDFEYIYNSFRQEVLNRRIRETVHSTLDILKVNPDDAYKYLTEHVRNLREAISVNRSVSDGQTDEKIDEYLQRGTNFEKLYPISSNASDIELALYFWPKGAFGIFQGITSVGKSYFTMDLAIRTAYMKDWKTVILSAEMPKDQCEIRFYSLLGRYSGYTFDPTSLLIGKGVNIKQYQEFLSSIKGREKWIIRDTPPTSPFTMDIIHSIVEDEMPDLLIMDGLELVQDTNIKAPDWVQKGNVAYGLKSLATVKNLVVFATVQATRLAAKKFKLTNEDVSNSYSIPRAADVVINIMYSKGDMNGNIVEEMDSEEMDTGNGKERLISVSKNRITGKLVSKPRRILFNPSAGEVGDLLE